MLEVPEEALSSPGVRDPLGSTGLVALPPHSSEGLGDKCRM